ncbi:response regulator [Allocoleopsis franciscana]|uniref:Response regulator with CheY-like receiver, AAA-type ATPase, and DNA-binding domains n=1 Tax=Allocoleopsis franciscana PCC 7113 TaxID=1173027 RepID=K9WJR9_9CYAN|nr:response regulator [Allocoleopsis franciscana]AFZ20443.1 response regulator with CheY-like receiver, AAA-type ATPase, and DNA-binding domains [Allocoleopsis franciscana PCC 7113]
MPKKAILCVDDERMILLSLRDQLTRHFGDRYHYEFAESADEAWEIIEELNDEGVKIITIVSDWLMPNMKGDEFLIKVHQQFPDVVTVMLTGQADESAIERARQYANLHRYIPKPWDESTLIEVLESGLEVTDE